MTYPMHDSDNDMLDDYPGCPACGEPIDYCQGHGEIGDPEGHAVLVAHEEGQHALCNPLGCEVAQDAHDVLVRPLTATWTPGSRAQRVPCAFVEWSNIPGYKVIIVEHRDGGVAERRKISVPGHQVD